MERKLMLLFKIHAMKIAKRILLSGVLLAALSSCHKDESYYCYLIEDDFFEPDTVDVFYEGFWIHKKTSKPEEKCSEAKDELDTLNAWDLNYSCHCSCEWIPD